VHAISAKSNSFKICGPLFLYKWKFLVMAMFVYLFNEFYTHVVMLLVVDEVPLIVHSALIRLVVLRGLLHVIAFHNMGNILKGNELNM
jgi:hypothetical protein